MATGMFRLLCALVFLATPALADVLFEDNFNSQTDWTLVQSSGDRSCWTGACSYESPPTNWTGYYNGGGSCGTYNNMYIYNVAGYPTGSETCRGGSGKCVTLWDESCVTSFTNSDGQLIKDLGSDYETIYLAFWIRFASGFTWAAASGGTTYPQHKYWHVQHFDTGFPWQYFGTNLGNQPLVSGGLQVEVDYGTTNMYDSIRGYCGESGLNDSCYYPNNANGAPDFNWLDGNDASGYRQLDLANDFFKRYNIEAWGSSAGKLGDGNWHHFEVRQTMNTWSGSAWNADGVVEIWIDGTKHMSRSDVPFKRCDNSSNCAPSSSRGWRVVSIGGNSANYFADSGTREQWYAIDDVVISTTYVGTSYVIGGATTPFILSW